MKRAHKRKPVLDRLFARRLVTDSGCWEWTGFRKPSGHGLIKIDGVPIHPSRVIYIALYGDPPEGWHVDHLCRNPPCFNPFHLEAVPAAVNTARGVAARFTGYCKRGHPLVGDNLAFTAKGHRKCRACHRALALASYYRCRYGGDGTRTRKSSRSPALEAGAFAKFGHSPSREDTR